MGLGLLDPEWLFLHDHSSVALVGNLYYSYMTPIHPLSA